MTKQLRAILLGVGLAITSAADAATTIDTAFFSLSKRAGSESDLNLQIVSQSGNSLKILVGNLTPPYSNPLSVTEEYGMTAGNSDWSSGSLDGNLKEGYRITSLVLSGETRGTLDVTPLVSPECGTSQLSCTTGSASNSARVAWSLEQDGRYTALPGMERGDITQTEAFALSSDQSLTGQFSLDLYLSLAASAKAGELVRRYDEWQVPYYVPSSATVAFNEPMFLTIQVAAVPEPGTYAMLFAGLGVLGVMTRRRRQ